MFINNNIPGSLGLLTHWGRRRRRLQDASAACRRRRGALRDATWCGSNILTWGLLIGGVMIFPNLSGFA